jgi:NADH-quinone oxidoreductase subunit C
MNFEEINNLIITHFGDNVVLSISKDGLMPFIEIKTEKLHAICDFLYRNEITYFDYLACITGIDLGNEQKAFEVVYNLYSIPYDVSYCLKIRLPKNELLEPISEIDTVSNIWRAANWHEREIFDLFGIVFKNHPDLRRILLPADWVGYPLRKDYKTDDYYHKLKIDY